MSCADSAELPQLWSLGWKIQARSFSSSVPQPTVSSAANAAAMKKTIQRFITGWEWRRAAKVLSAAHEQRIELAHGQLPPSGAPVVALVGALGLLHLPQ